MINLRFADIGGPLGVTVRAFVRLPGPMKGETKTSSAARERVPAKEGNIWGIVYDVVRALRIVCLVLDGRGHLWT